MIITYEKIQYGEKDTGILDIMSGRLEQSHFVLRVVEQWFQISKAPCIFNERDTEMPWTQTFLALKSFKEHYSEFNN